MSKKVKKIEIDNLQVTYGAKIALKGITLDVYENEILGIIGPAQSGKTTLVKTILLLFIDNSLIYRTIEHCFPVM